MGCFEHISPPCVSRQGRSVLVALLGLLLAGGCSEDARLAGHSIPHVVVETVTDQGVVVGPEAGPQEVAFVLLRAIRDDVQAGSDREARREALMRQLAVCDPDYIYELYQDVMDRRAVYERDEWVYKKVRLWAPTLAYYVDSFGMDLPRAKERLTTSPTSRRENWPGETIQVDLPARDPHGEPGADVVVRIRLHKHTTGGWRVFHVGFAKTRPPAQAFGEPQSPPTSE